MLKYLPMGQLTEEQVGHMAHTDVGSLTLLFTSAPGLQVMRGSEWIDVTPEKGCIVVNVGDTLSFLSGMRLKSCLHRVIPSSANTRYSLAFFHRPELKAQFYDGDGNKWTGEDWHRTKYKIFRAGSEEQKQGTLLTGRLGFLGTWNNEELVV
jgi:isopenicillin N synthase-like dioxygenase